MYEKLKNFKNINIFIIIYILFKLSYISFVYMLLSHQLPLILVTRSFFFDNLSEVMDIVFLIYIQDEMFIYAFFTVNTFKNFHQVLFKIEIFLQIEL